MFQAAPFNLQISASTPDVFDGRIIAAVPYGTKVKIERADELVIDASLGFSPRGEAAQAIEIRSLTLTSFFIFSLLLKLTLRNAPKSKNPSQRLGFRLLGGEGGIRTRDTLLEYTHFPGALLQPLGHLSILTASWFAVPCWGAKVGIFYGFFNL